ncbi:MAG: GIY-YIG nuclease family protein, partial [Waterburya sp.]
GIYRIRCKITGASYVGQAVDIKRRWQQHTRALDNKEYSKSNPQFQKDWNKYGQRSFNFSILKLCPRYSLDRLEAIYVRKYGQYNSQIPRLRNLCFMEYLDIAQNFVVVVFLIWVGYKFYEYIF